MGNNVTITTTPDKKMALVDNPYLAPVVMTVRQSIWGLAAPFKMAGSVAKKLILQRKLSFDENFATFMTSTVGGSAGLVLGIAGAIGFAKTVVGGIGIIAGALVAGPLATVAAVAAAMCVGGAVYGFGKGVMKLARHTLAPKLLEAEERARQKEQGIKALPAPEAQTFSLTVKITPDFTKTQQGEPVREIPAAVARHIKH